MRGRWRVCLGVFALAMGACAGAPDFVASDTEVKGKTEVGTEIGEPAVLDRSEIGPATTVAAASLADAPLPPNVSVKRINGVDLHLQIADGVNLPEDSATRLALSITNKTGKPIGYLTNRETHFLLVSEAGKALWTDETCRRQPFDETVTGFLKLDPGEAITIDDFYPTRPGRETEGCTAPPGQAFLMGGVTVCRELREDWTCPDGVSERLQATAIAVTVR